jgi:hypothetical protein
MNSQRFNADCISTLEKTIPYEEFFAARNLSATLKGVGEVEIAEGIATPGKPGLVPQIPGVVASPATYQANLEVVVYSPFESPFEKLDELREEEEMVRKVISHIRGHLRADFADRLADRLEFLLDAAKEEYPDEVAILPESLKNFISFLHPNPELKYPDVVLSPAKNIRAQWRTAPNRHFAVEFLATGDTRFVVFSPDPNHPVKTIRLSGLVSIESLMRTVEPLGVLNWSSQ